MTTSPAEFSRIYRVDSIGERPRTVDLEADAAERAALATRFGLQSIALLKGSAALSRVAGGIAASGRLEAQVEQFCVATGEPVPATISESFSLKFVAAEAGVPADEIELEEDDLDIVDFDGQAVDMGEALAQTMALALDPFPRSPNAETTLRQAGVLSEEEAGAFGPLAALKKKMTGGA